MIKDVAQGKVEALGSMLNVGEWQFGLQRMSGYQLWDGMLVSMYGYGCMVTAITRSLHSMADTNRHQRCTGGVKIGPSLLSTQENRHAVHPTSSKVAVGRARSM